MFNDFFKRRKMRSIGFGDLEITWVSGGHSFFSVVFFENDNGKRKYVVKGGNLCSFLNTSHYSKCEIWKQTGLLPKWAKDPIAEKLSR